MSNGEDFKPKKIEWKGVHTPEQTNNLNEGVLRRRGLKVPDAPERPNPLEGLDPDIVKLARMKADQILARASYTDHMSALAHIDRVIADKTPAQMIEALDDVILAAAGKSQLASEIELALAFLLLTDEPSEP